MKLAHVEIECQMMLSNQKLFEWIIESPELFSKYVREIVEQINGGEGRFVLSEGERELNLSKYAEIIVNPFLLDLNDRRIQKKMYAELAELAKGEELFLATQEMMAVLRRYFLQLEHASGYALEIIPEIEVTAIFKAIGIQIERVEDDFFIRLLQYIRIMAELMKKKLVVLVNIRSYLNEFQISQLLEMTAYDEIALLFIENVQRDFSEEKIYCIIDKDGCEIY